MFDITYTKEDIKKAKKRGYQKGYRAGKKNEHWKEIERKAAQIMVQTGLDASGKGGTGGAGSGGTGGAGGPGLKYGLTGVKK